MKSGIEDIKKYATSGIKKGVETLYGIPERMLSPLVNFISDGIASSYSSLPEYKKAAIMNSAAARQGVQKFPEPVPGGKFGLKAAAELTLYGLAIMGGAHLIKDMLDGGVHEGIGIMVAEAREIDPCEINPDACITPTPTPELAPEPVKQPEGFSGFIFGKSDVERFSWFEYQLKDGDSSNDHRAKGYLESFLDDYGMKSITQFENKYNLPHMDNIVVLDKGDNGTVHWYKIGEKDADGNIINTKIVSVKDRIPE